MRKQFKQQRPYRIIAIAGIVLVAATTFFVLTARDQAGKNTPRLTARVYYAPTCGCCGEYIRYLRRAGFDVQPIPNQTEVWMIKDQYSIPAEMRSCHTTVIGDYVIEGHMPVEAIAKLLNERPSLRGIAMPGMPSGSPGMPGPKTAPFTIYGLMPNGQTNLYLSL